MSKNLHYIKYSFYALVISFLIQSCEIINPAEQIPFYLRIDSISFIDSSTTPPTITKPGVQKITDAWVFVDGEYQGTYELPTTLPIDKPAGNHRINISPGILTNGMNSDRRIYPFFTDYQININTVEGRIDTIVPKVSYYKDGPNYPPEGAGQFPEGFEGAGTILKIGPSSKVDTIIRTSDNNLVFDGNFSLLFELDATKDYVEFETAKSYSLPLFLRPVYVELNFRSDVNFTMGLYAENALTGQVIVIPFITLLETEGEWKKVYLNLSNEIVSYSGSKFKLWFNAKHNTNLVKSQLLIDNLKIIYQ
jgi:hypothetical protein